MSVCCDQCGHCTFLAKIFTLVRLTDAHAVSWFKDEVIAEMSDCKCKCHHIDDYEERPELELLKEKVK